MRIIHQASELAPASRKVCVAIGVFDGVHLGHQQVIRQTMTDAQQHGAVSVVITFDRHPSSIVAPARTIPLIYPLSQKLRVIASLGVETTLLIRFGQAFSQQSGDAFIRQLVADFGSLYSVCVGSNFTFGHKRSGNVNLLTTLGHELNFIVHGLAAVSLDGKVVSSTRIREAIRQGNLDAASQMLGRAYSLSGTVIRGDQLGRKLGFPTANLGVSGLLLPPNGVYAIRARVQAKTYPGALNIGFRPTLQNPQPQIHVEAHLLDFQGDLYGEEMEVTIVEKLREEQKFASIDELSAQIQRDIDQTRRILS
jgi:riboflavin kinase / FMN adenylyltransferase